MYAGATPLSALYSACCFRPHSVGFQFLDQDNWAVMDRWTSGFTFLHTTPFSRSQWRVWIILMCTYAQVIKQWWKVFCSIISIVTVSLQSIAIRPYTSHGCARPLCPNTIALILIYTVAQKSKPQSFVHIFAKYWPIFKLFSLVNSVKNL